MLPILPITLMLPLMFTLHSPFNTSSLRSISQHSVRKVRMASTDANRGSGSTPPYQAKVRYDLYRGHPNNNALPTSEMQSIMSSLLHDTHKSFLISSLGYGANAGNDALLSSLRSFLERRRLHDDTGDAMSPSNIIDTEFFITGGVSHGIELLCSTCTSPGDEVWIERPTYFLAPKIFTGHGLVIKPLPMMSDRQIGNGEDNRDTIGQIDIDRLIQMIEQDGSPKMMYIIPSYHNPTGRSMTVKERRKLAALAIKYNILLVADEVYHLLDWDRKSFSEVPIQSSSRPAAMPYFNKIRTSNDNKEQSMLGCCISVSSFTKIFAPGVRVGWIEAPSHIIKRLTSYGYINSQGGVAPFMGALMTQAMETGLLDRYLDSLILEYSGRYEMICGILEKEPRITILTKHSPVEREGGYFVWVQFPSDVNSEEFASYCMAECGLRIFAGSKSDPFPLIKDNATHMAVHSCVRLCFADLDREVLAKATSVFVEAFQTFMLDKQ
jgi:2-aminoadipate transaminase